jgi:cell division protein FtsA
VKFGSAWPGENRDNEIVSIQERGREPKEILKTCQNNSRTWLKSGAGFTEIKAYGTKTPQEINGIVLTGGGAQLKHIKVSRIHYGMDTRIGYPNEHLGDSDEFSSPLYATAVG